MFKPSFTFFVSILLHSAYALTSFPRGQTVSVSMLEVGTETVPAGFFIEPVLPGHERFNFPVFAFLVEHCVGNTTRRLMFDLGLRSDTENFPPAVKDMIIHSTASVSPTKDVATQLREGGIPLESVEAIVMSHLHFDHVGAAGTFPNSTKVMLGPGAVAKYLPGYPTNPASFLMEEDIVGRDVVEVNFNTSSPVVGGFHALDYFGDGSFYILNAPGHTTGHLNALARVTNNPDTFVFFAADTGHHVAQLRPSPKFSRYFPCPGEIVASKPASPQYFDGPGLKNTSNLAVRNIPLERIKATPLTFYEDPVEANATLKKLADNMDSDPNVFVIIAHDTSLIIDRSPKEPKGAGVVRVFPDKLDAWKEKKWKEKTVWQFAKKENPGFRTQPKTCAVV